jgi:branched-chain amino acid transport system ATP-binding protein
VTAVSAVSAVDGLAIRGLHRHFGGVAAVDGVDLDIPTGSITALIGPNGAGKTTLLHCVTGLDAADSGTISLTHTPLDGLPAYERARRGLAWTFQRIELFAGLTVAENVRVGAENRRGRALLRGLLGLPDPRREALHATVTEVLSRLGLTAVAETPAGSLPTGTMRLVELGRALAARPTALLLDEPASGLDDHQILRLADVLRDLAESGLAVLLVEHDMRFVEAVADHVHLMASGRVLVSGTADAVLADPAARRVYLGEP